jgi:hypothetical protein
MPLQAWHWPVHALLQQTPSTHSALAHWSAAVQCAPLAPLDTQEWPALQYAVAMHWESLAQVVGHEPAAQTYGSQRTPELA